MEGARGEGGGAPSGKGRPVAGYRTADHVKGFSKRGHARVEQELRRNTWTVFQGCRCRGVRAQFLGDAQARAAAPCLRALKMICNCKRTPNQVAQRSAYAG